MDVSDRAAVERAAKETEAAFGRLDILVNNAGYLERNIPIVDSDPDEWWKTWTVVSTMGCLRLSPRSMDSRMNRT